MILDPDRVVLAAAGIDRAHIRTPQYVSDGLSRELGFECVLKLETVNPSGSVAGRSVEWWLRQERPPHRIVCGSEGDFGLAMGRACRRRGIELDIFAPVDTDPAKIEALRRGGATVWLEGADLDDAVAEARRYAQVVDARYVEDGREPAFVEGAATMAAELEHLDQRPDAVFVPLDRGALALGTALWCHSRMPSTRVVGVGPVGAMAMVRSVRERRLVTTTTVATTASALAIRLPIEELVVPLSDALDDTATVTDEQLAEAVLALADHEGLRVSASGAAALAAAVSAASSLRGRCVVVPVTSRSIG
ncbi:MAG: PLP-dependent lyase/thiolase [Acidimicrobiales bacterium]